MPEKPLTFLHIEPHSWWREIVATSVAHWREYRLVGAVATGLEGVEHAMALHPQVVLFDSNLSDIDSADLAAALQSMSPAPKLVLLNEEVDAATQAFVERFHVAGVVRKNTRVSEHLPAALGEIRAGRTYLPLEFRSASVAHRG